MTGKIWVWRESGDGISGSTPRKLLRPGPRERDRQKQSLKLISSLCYNIQSVTDLSGKRRRYYSRKRKKNKRKLYQTKEKSSPHKKCTEILWNIQIKYNGCWSDKYQKSQFIFLRILYRNSPTWNTPIVLTTACFTWGVHEISYDARKWLDTAIKASFGHRWNQSIVHPEINPGNLRDRLRNFSPT